MRCVVTKQILRAGRLIPVGEEIDIPLDKYERLRASGHVDVPAGHASVTQARQEAAAFVAEAEQSAEAERARALAAEAEQPAEGDTDSGAQRRSRRQR